MSRAAIAAALALVVLASGCVAGGVIIKAAGDGQYRVTVERCGSLGNEADRAKVLAELRRSADHECARRGATISTPRFESSFGGYGPILGECMMVRAEATARCR